MITYKAEITGLRNDFHSEAALVRFNFSVGKCLHSLEIPMSREELEAHPLFLRQELLIMIAVQPQSPNRAESPTYREPTIEDVGALREAYDAGCFVDPEEDMLTALKQLGFVRKVTPNE